MVTKAESDKAWLDYQEDKPYIWDTIAAEYYMDLLMIDCARGVLPEKECIKECRKVIKVLPELRKGFRAYYDNRMKRWLAAMGR